jgi:hypothetical protein
MRTREIGPATLALLLAACPPPTAEPTTASATGDSSGASGGQTSGPSAGTADSGVEPTTGEPGSQDVILPTLRTYRPRGGGEVSVSHDPLPEHTSVRIAAAGQTFWPIYNEVAARLEFAGVPEVVYQLFAERPPRADLPGEPGPLEVTLSAARKLALYTGSFSGRPDVAATDDVATAIEVSATGMLPLLPEDQFEFYSYNADAQLLIFPALDPEDATGSPQLDETEIAGWTIDWRPESGRGGWPLIDPSAGDDFWLGHLVAGPLVPAPVGAELQDAWSYAQRYVLAEAAELSLAPMAAGATTAVSGAFAPVASRTVNVDLRAGEFMAELAVYDAPLKSVGCFVAAVLEPGVEHPIHGMTPNLGGINVYGKDVPVDPSCEGEGCETMFATPGDRVLALEVGNPFAHGTETLVVQCSRYVFVEDPNGVSYDYLAADMIVSGRLADLAQGPIRPKIGLVRDLAVNGVAAAPTKPMPGVGRNPTITFTAPKYGAPDFYTVTVRTISDAEGTDGLIPRRVIGKIRTESTSVVIPDGFLEPGKHYYIQVTAERSHALTEAHPASHEVHLSRAMTGVITP